MLFASEVAVTHRNLATIDLVIVGIYFAIVFGIGLYFARKERTSEDYFLAGRDIGWFFIGASLFVSNISTEHFIGLSGTGASSGLAVGHFEWLACLILLILGWVFVPFYLRSNVFTMPEFLERRFNRQSAVYLAGISIIAYIFTKISVQLYAASVVLERVAGWPLWKTAVVLVIATGIYTVAGGLAAVIYTDTVQTLILITGAVALTIIGLGRVGGLEHLRTMVPPDYFHMIKPSSDHNFPWTGIFFGAPILGIWYWCTDQVIVQRVLSARDEGHAKAGTIFAGFLKILPVFMLVLPGSFDARHPRLLQENPPRSLRAPARQFRARRHRNDGSSRPVMGSFHWVHQQSVVHLSAKRPGLHQSADLRVLYSRNPLAQAQRLGRHRLASNRLCHGRDPLCP